MEERVCEEPKSGESPLWPSQGYRQQYYYQETPPPIMMRMPQMPPQLFLMLHKLSSQGELDVCSECQQVKPSYTDLADFGLGMKPKTDFDDCNEFQNQFTSLKRQRLDNERPAEFGVPLNLFPGPPSRDQNEFEARFAESKRPQREHDIMRREKFEAEKAAIRSSKEYEPLEAEILCSQLEPWKARLFPFEERGESPLWSSQGYRQQYYHQEIPPPIMMRMPQMPPQLLQLFHRLHRLASQGKMDDCSKCHQVKWSYRDLGEFGSGMKPKTDFGDCNEFQTQFTSLKRQQRENERPAEFGVPFPGPPSWDQNEFEARFAESKRRLLQQQREHEIMKREKIEAEIAAIRCSKEYEPWEAEILCSQLEARKARLFPFEERFDVYPMSDATRCTRPFSDIKHHYAKIALEFYEKSQDVEYEMVEALYSARSKLVVPGANSEHSRLPNPSVQYWCHVSFLAKPKNADCNNASPRYVFAELLKDEPSSRFIVKYCSTFEPSDDAGFKHGCVLCPADQKFHPGVDGYRIGAPPCSVVRTLFF